MTTAATAADTPPAETIDSPTARHRFGSRAAWSVADLDADRSWTFQLTPEEAGELIAAVRKGRVEGKPLLSYRRADFPLGVSLKRLAAAFSEVRNGRGLALIKGLPREGVTPEEFELMTWMIGLHFGVARPQDRHSAFINKVKDTGGQYRSPTGRGYSSNAELDFHVDGSDIVLLSCYNQAQSGGMSMCTSSVKAFETVLQERPDLAEVLVKPFPFSRNGEHQPDEAPWFLAPLVGFEDGRTVCVWNRNRFINATRIPEVPPVDPLQREAVGYLDAVVRRPDLMYCMKLEPGDLQLLSNQTALHSRTRFEDYPDEARKRTLFRLWLAMPDSFRLPPGWEHYAGTTEPKTVRGGSKGFQYTEACREFEVAQARDMGMTFKG